MSRTLRTASVLLAGLYVGPAHAARNVLLIIADDLGAEELESYSDDLLDRMTAATTSDAIVDEDADGIPDGLEDADGDGIADGSVPMPNVDALVDAGVRFSDSWSAPACSPSRAGIFTGNYPSHNYVGDVIGKSNTIWTLPMDSETIADRMNTYGAPHTKGLFGKWHLGSTVDELPTAFGWDYFAGRMVEAGHGTTDSHYSWDRTVVDEVGAVTTTTVTDYDADVEVDDALAWINDQTGPWWATVAFHAVHDPFEAPPDSCLGRASTGTTDREIYREMVECLDVEVGRLIDGIPTDDLANTTIIFIGDNGTPGPVSDVYTNARAKSSIYEGGLQVPFIVADGAALLGATSTGGKGSVNTPGRTVDAPVLLVDLFPTLAEITGVRTTGVDGMGLNRYLAVKDPSTKRNWKFSEKFSYSSTEIANLKQTLQSANAVLEVSDAAGLAVIDRKAVYVRGLWALVYEGGTYALYDRDGDPFEQTDVWCTSTVASIAGPILAAELNAIDSRFPTATCD